MTNFSFLGFYITNFSFSGFYIYIFYFSGFYHFSVQVSILLTFLFQVSIRLTFPFQVSIRLTFLFQAPIWLIFVFLVSLWITVLFQIYIRLTFLYVFLIVRTAMEAISLLDVINHDKFKDFIASNKIWRNQTKIRKIFCDIVHILTGVSHHGHGNKCLVERISHNFISNSKSKVNMKVGFPKFKLMNTKWMSDQFISSNCPEYQQVIKVIYIN